MPPKTRPDRTSESTRKQYDALVAALSSAFGASKSDLPRLPATNAQAMLVVKTMRATIKVIDPSLLEPPPREATPMQLQVVTQIVGELRGHPGFVSPYKGGRLTFDDAYACISRWKHLRPATAAQMRTATRIAQNLSLPIPREDGIHTRRAVGEFIKAYMAASIDMERSGGVVPLSRDELADLQSIQEDVRRGNPCETSYAELQRQLIDDGFLSQ